MWLLYLCMEERICSVCDKKMNEYKIYDPETDKRVGTEITCPDEWRASHGNVNAQHRQFDNKAQLMRHVSDDNNRDIDKLWAEYKSQRN